MSLINREDLIAEYDRVHVGAPGGARKLMVDAPTVEPERKTGADNGCTFLTCKHGGFGDDACSKCRWAYRDMYEPDEEGAQP